VFMTDEHGIEPVHVGIEQLLAQVRRRVDKDPGDATLARLLHQDRAAAPPVPGIVRIAGAPAQRRSGYPARRAAAEDRDGQAHATASRGTFENRRKKFSVVCRATSSGDTPCTSARTFAVSVT